MLLPRNVERRQWVSRYYRIKVLLNVADNIHREYGCLCSTLYSAKTQRVESVLFGSLKISSLIVERFFILTTFKEVIGMDDGPASSYLINRFKEFYMSTIANCYLRVLSKKINIGYDIN